MRTHPNPASRAAPAGRAVLTVALGAALAAACSPPPHRTYDFFLENSIARDGVIARCERDPAAAQLDIECANARRAALAIQLEEERTRREALERESAAKIEAMRREYAARQQAAHEAEAAQAAQQAGAGAGPGAADAAAEPVLGDDSSAPAGGLAGDPTAVTPTAAAPTVAAQTASAPTAGAADAGRADDPTLESVGGGAALPAATVGDPAGEARTFPAAPAPSPVLAAPPAASTEEVAAPVEPRPAAGPGLGIPRPFQSAPDEPSESVPPAN